MTCINTSALLAALSVAPPVSPALLIGAIAFNLLYHIGLTLFNFYLWKKTANSAYFKNAKHGALNTLINIAIITIFAIVMISPLSPAINTALVIGATAIALFAISKNIYAFIKNYRTKNTTHQTKTHIIHASNSPLLKNNETNAKPSQLDYEQHVNLEQSILTRLLQQPTKFDAETSITEILSTKINSLQKQNHDVTYQPTFFKSRTANKRNKKFAFLSELKTLISDHEAPEKILSFIEKNESAEVYESLFRSTGEIEAIVNGIKAYLTQQTQPSSMTELVCRPQ